MASRTATLSVLIIFAIYGLSFASEMPSAFWPENEYRMDQVHFLNSLNSSISFHGLYNSDTGLPQRVFVNRSNESLFKSRTVNNPLSFIDQNYEVFQVSSSELDILQNTEVQGKHYFTARQKLDDRVVLNSRIILRSFRDKQLMLWGSDISPLKDAIWTSSLTAPKAVEILADFCGLKSYQTIESEETWLMIDEQTVPTFFIRLAGFDADQRPLAVIDSRNGEILGYYNEVYHEDITGTVTGPYLPYNFSDDPVFDPFSFTEVRADNAREYTDASGVFLFQNLVNGREYNISSRLSGTWAQVDYEDGPNASYSSNATAPGNHEIEWALEDGRMDEFNTFYHANFIHEFYEILDPDFNALDYQMPIVVDYDHNYENAFWNGTGMFFGAGGGRLRNLALFSDIIYHEYTHGVTGGIYPPGTLPYINQSGALNEAWSDYFPCSIHDSPAMSRGIYIDTPFTPMRNLDNNRRYPESWVDEVHGDGLIPGGAMWHTREILGAEITDPLFHFARYGFAENFEAYLIEVLITDDDNNDITDGTPNDIGIYAGFGRHGIGPGIQPNLVVEDLEITDENNDGIYLSDEAVELSFSILNDVDLYPPAASSVQITATANDLIVWNVNQVDLGNISPGQSVEIPVPLQLNIAEEAPTQYVDIEISISANEGQYENIFIQRIVVGSPQILIVDDDGNESYQEYYEEMMNGLFTAATRWDTHNGTPGNLLLQEYPVVIWHTGDARLPINEDDKDAIIDYVEQGGGLIFTGQHIGTQLNFDREFAEFLGVSVSIDSLNPARAVVGAAENPLSMGITSLVTGQAGVGGTGGASNQVAPSSMIPTDEAIPLYSYHYDGGDIAAIQKEFDGGGTVFYFGFGLESVSGAANTDDADVILWPLINALGVELVTGVEENNELPLEFSLSQPYPNPFNPETRISYHLPESIEVRLSVYNMLGQEVIQLFDKKQNAGSHQVLIDMSSFASGVYLINLKTAESSYSRKAVLMK